MNVGRQELLTRTECNVVRGLAIIGIFLHNYCHWLRPIVKENEYQFFQHNVDWFQRVFLHPDGYLLMHLLSFFGHYGVPLFLFLSAYGLVKKYERPCVPVQENMPHPNPWAFIRYHFLKLFKMMIVGFVAFTMVDAITPGRWHYDVVKIIAQLGMFNNLLPNPDHQIWPGPYWFFGLMLQLYIVYRLIIYRRHWSVTVGLMLACVVIQLFLDPEGETINRYRYNFMGGMLPFGFGILVARFESRIHSLIPSFPHSFLLCVISAILIYILSLNFYAWTFVPIAVCAFGIGFAWIISFIGSYRWGHPLLHCMEWMGSISAALFVCHPITRKIFIPISRQGDIYTGFLLYILASICLAWVFAALMKRIPNPKMKE